MVFKKLQSSELELWTRNVQGFTSQSDDMTFSLQLSEVEIEDTK